MVVCIFFFFFCLNYLQFLFTSEYIAIVMVLSLITCFLRIYFRRKQPRTFIINDSRGKILDRGNDSCRFFKNFIFLFLHLIGEFLSWKNFFSSTRIRNFVQNIFREKFFSKISLLNLSIFRGIVGVHQEIAGQPYFFIFLRSLSSYVTSVIRYYTNRINKRDAIVVLFYNYHILLNPRPASLTRKYKNYTAEISLFYFVPLFFFFLFSVLTYKYYQLLPPIVARLLIIIIIYITDSPPLSQGGHFQYRYSESRIDDRRSPGDPCTELFPNDFPLWSMREEVRGSCWEEEEKYVQLMTCARDVGSIDRNSIQVILL